MMRSGKLNLRMSSSLHAHLVAGAARESVSLNAWIISLLAGASGFKQQAAFADAIDEQLAQDRASAESSEFVRRNG